MAAAISVVVPVYNAEKYLKECVDSLLSQTFRDVEFIFVDDGSTDRSVEILEEYQKKDGRIQILQQQNQYAGVARNNGMKAATGKYIIFLDSDDFFELTMLEEAYNCAEKNHVQMVVFSFQNYDDQTHNLSPCRNQLLPGDIFSADNCSDSFFLDIYAAPWNKLYLSEFVRTTNISFQPVRKANDAFFVLTTSCLASRIYYLQKSLVYYRINNSASLQGNVKSERASFVAALQAVKAELEKRGRFKGNVRSSFICYTTSCINYYFNLGNWDSTLLHRYYDSLKTTLIPDLFDSPSDFYRENLISTIYESSDYDDFLFRLLAIEKQRNEELTQRVKRLYNDTISKKSASYRLGEFLLFLPRKLIRLFSFRK